MGKTPLIWETKGLPDRQLAAPVAAPPPTYSSLFFCCSLHCCLTIINATHIHQDQGTPGHHIRGRQRTFWSQSFIFRTWWQLSVDHLQNVAWVWIGVMQNLTTRASTYVDTSLIMFSEWLEKVKLFNKTFNWNCVLYASDLMFHIHWKPFYAM